MPNIQVQARVTKTSAFNGASVDVSAVKDYGFVLRVNSLTEGKRVHFELQDSADAFSNNVVRRVFEVKGSIPPDGIVLTVHSRDMPMCRKNGAGAVLRLVITGIDADTSVNYEAWLEAI